jgi:hypothetical protein
MNRFALLVALIAVYVVAFVLFMTALSAAYGQPGVTSEQTKEEIAALLSQLRQQNDTRGELLEYVNNISEGHQIEGLQVEVIPPKKGSVQEKVLNESRAKGLVGSGDIEAVEDIARKYGMTRQNITTPAHNQSQ